MRILLSAAILTGSHSDFAAAMSVPDYVSQSYGEAPMSRLSEQALGPVLEGAFPKPPSIRQHIAMMKKAAALRRKVIVVLYLFKPLRPEYLFLKELVGRMKELAPKAIFPREMKIYETADQVIKIERPDKMVPLSRKSFWENMTMKNNVHSQRTDQQLVTAQRIAQGLPRLAYRMRMAGIFVADRNTNFFSITVLDGAYPVVAVPQKLTSDPLQIELAVSGFADKLLHDFEVLLSSKKNDVRWAHGNALQTMMRRELIKNGFFPSTPAKGMDPSASQWEDVEFPIDALTDREEKAKALSDLGVQQASTGLDADRRRSIATFQRAFQTARLMMRDRHKQIAVLIYIATNQGVVSQIDEAKPVWEFALDRASQFKEPTVQDDQMLKVLRRWAQILPPESIALFWQEILRRYQTPLLQIAAAAALARLSVPTYGEAAWKPLWTRLNKLPRSVEQFRGYAIAGRELQLAGHYDLAQRAFAKAVTQATTQLGGYEIVLLQFIMNEQLAVDRLEDARQTAGLISDENIRDQEWVDIASLYGDIGNIEKMIEIRDQILNPEFKGQIQKLIEDIASPPVVVKAVPTLEPPEVSKPGLWDRLYQEKLADRREKKANGRRGRLSA